MDVSPSDAIAAVDEVDEATEAVAEATSEHAAAEGVDATETSGAGSSSALREMLFSTGPETPLAQVEAPWNPEEGGITRIYRGLQKMLDIDGLPAIADITIGAAEFITGADLDVGGEADQDDHGGPTEETPIV